MAQQKQGWLSRLYEGREKSEDYARNSLPTNRWSLFWDIFKGNFGKIIKINLFVFKTKVSTLITELSMPESLASPKRFCFAFQIHIIALGQL